ncbi:hypothetical protein J7L13_00900 [bacterium]|nr:hypothetical protein [bacterium]
MHVLGSQIADKIRVSGKFVAIVRDAKTGKILQRVETPNTILECGKQQLAKIFAGESSEFFNYCAVGSDATPPDSSQTGLLNEIGRVQVTQKTASGNQITISTFFSAADCNGEWNEVGLVTKQSGGVFLNRALFPSTIQKTSTKTVTVDCILTIG